MPAAELLLTGERTLPGIASENYWFRRHEAAYLFLRQQLAGHRLLEVGCGEGYGAQLLSDRFDQTIALDYDPAAMAGLPQRYPRLAPCRASLAALPVRTGSCAAVVSLQVLEHVWAPAEFLTECRRVLEPGGELVLSTPNRLTFSPGLARGAKPANPFHVREYDADEVIELLARSGFTVVELLNLASGPRLDELDRAWGGLVAAQLRTEPGDWSIELAKAVAGVTAADFTVSDEGISNSLDLIVRARPA